MQYATDSQLLSLTQSLKSGINSVPDNDHEKIVPVSACNRLKERLQFAKLHQNNLFFSLE